MCFESLLILIVFKFKKRPNIYRIRVVKSLYKNLFSGLLIMMSKRERETAVVCNDSSYTGVHWGYGEQLFEIEIKLLLELLKIWVRDRKRD